MALFAILNSTGGFKEWKDTHHSFLKPGRFLTGINSGVPSFDPSTHKVVETTPVLNSGSAYIRWIVQPLSQDEISIRNTPSITGMYANIVQLTNQVSQVSGEGGLPALNASWTSGTTNFVVAGDSIPAGWSSLASIPALNNKVTYSNVAVVGSYLGSVDGSGPGHNIFARYSADVFPKRPAANGGVAGITKSILLIMIGTNNNYDLALARYATYIATAKSHGFTVIACTVYARSDFRAAGGATPYTVQAARNYALFNRGIYDGTAGADYVVPFDMAYFGITDSAIAGDRLHLNTVGNARAHIIINHVLLSDGRDFTPSANLFKMGRVVGAAPGCIPSNDTWGDATHYWRAAQGPQINSLSYGVDMSWDTELYQCGNIVLTGAVSTLTPVNQQSGPTYELWVQHNGHAITWAYPIIFGSIPTTISATTGHWDYYKFKCKDNLLVCVQHETGYSFVTPPEPGAIFQEDFGQTGAAAPGVALHNTQADILGIEGETWWTNAYSAFNLGVLRKHDENRSTGGGITLYDHGLADNFEIVFKNVAWGQSVHTSGFVIKAASKSALSPNTTEGPQWILLNCNNSGGVNYIGLRSQGAGGTGNLGGLGGTLASSLGIAPGDDLRVTVISNVLRLYVNADPVAKVTATLPAGVAGGTVNGFIFAGGGSTSQMIVSDLAP